MNQPTTMSCDVSDADLLEQFEACTLPASQWTHRAHVRIAYLYLDRHDFDEAMERLRIGLKRFNPKNLPETATTGYNETMTRAFLQIVYTMKTVCGRDFENSDAFCDAHPELLSKHILRLFYSPARCVHPDAKTSFVEPDLAPLPSV